MVRLRDFPRTFWVANVMELFERAAYYGLNSVLAVYLSLEVVQGGLGFDKQSVGFLLSIVYAATYVIPIVGGALADRYGYRRMVLLAFALLSAGYFASGRMSSYALVFLFLLLMATGGGLFKPIISGTIARTTDERTSAIGFGIYYWMINVGAFAAPLLVSWYKGISWQLVFTASAAYTTLMLLPAAFVYRDPPRPENTRSLRESLLGAVEVLGDARFMLIVVVYSGFWVLYFQNFGTVLYYLRDFVDRAPVSAAVNHALSWIGLGGFEFDIEHVTSINALTIIALQIVVSAIVRERAALATMVGGMVIGAAGFALLAVSRNPWVFIAGIAVFSIGEMTAHPKYYSFIGLFAPADRKAVYMGYAFLYGVFGSLIGTNLGTLFYESYLQPAMGTPAAAGRSFWFWMTFAILDAVAAAGLYLVGRRFGADTPDTRRGARRVMVGVYLAVAALGIGVLGYDVGAHLAWSAPLNYKTAVQALLFIALGGGGIAILRRGPRRAEGTS